MSDLKKRVAKLIALNAGGSVPVRVTAEQIDELYRGKRR